MILVRMRIVAGAVGVRILTRLQHKGGTLLRRCAGDRLIVVALTVPRIRFALDGGVVGVAERRSPIVHLIGTFFCLGLVCDVARDRQRAQNKA